MDKAALITAGAVIIGVLLGFGLNRIVEMRDRLERTYALLEALAKEMRVCKSKAEPIVGA